MQSNESTGQNPQLIATCWTSAGDAAPLGPTECSPLAISERIAAVAETGWAGIGLVHDDLLVVRDSIGYEELGRQIKAAGIGIVEVEFINGWWSTGAERKAADKVQAELFEAATLLGARHIKVGAGNAGEPLPISLMTGAFSDLADQAADVGIRLALEATPFSNLRTTAEAIQVVTASDSPSAGLMIDIWHTAKSGLSHEELWNITPMDRVFAVEIDDGFHKTDGTLFEDTINNRAYCGRGDFDPATFIKLALEAGYLGPWGVEIISREHRSTPLREGLQRAFDTAVASFPG
ncbi:sugar phosphate isomerase/epimerase family protein [Paeniglutamicibacter psychrophenolicus]|uniref:sugar phosphate isomerase/epimerase family protein n=1 Tax=Paeniglutamicibacter psychrophenolicus TaxID=257454 RepID=UPI0027813024|nr:sugar phosphate isomerase/epimerase [Paeniglutamicibacter psychrophenolicus]MDQ0092253.1 sugar phosphate isomerase/epimerase [Paeniglutamicibacter psychrophenolicus]